MDTGVVDQACAILQATNDGDDLSPPHLKLLESAVNGFLNEAGMAAFDALCLDVERGYKKPWLHGVENLMIDHVGYVKWKGVTVEHFTPSWAYSAEARVQAEEVGRRCRLLEDRGASPSMLTVVWKWED